MSVLCVFRADCWTPVQIFRWTDATVLWRSFQKMNNIRKKIWNERLHFIVLIGCNTFYFFQKERKSVWTTWSGLLLPLYSWRLLVFISDSAKRVDSRFRSAFYPLLDLQGAARANRHLLYLLFSTSTSLFTDFV